MKEIKENTNGKTSYIHELEELIFVKMSILTKTIYRLNVIPIKILMALFVEID